MFQTYGSPKRALVAAAMMIISAASMAHAQQTSRGTAVVYPMVYSRDSGSGTARKTGVRAVEEALQKGGYNIVSGTVAANTWKRLQLRSPSTNQPATLTELIRFGKAVKARYVVAPVFDFHSRSIWVDLGPKTVSTATVDIAITDVAQRKTVYDKEDISARSDEKFNLAKAGADILVSPIVSVVSGGPKTPHEQRAVQIAVSKAMRDWVKPVE